MLECKLVRRGVNSVKIVKIYLKFKRGEKNYLMFRILNGIKIV